MRSHEAGVLHAPGYGGPPIYLPSPADVMEVLPTLWARTVTRRPDGDVEVSISYHDRAWLARFLLGHADVVTPSDPDLVAEIAARAAEGLGHYDSDPAAG